MQLLPDLILTVKVLFLNGSNAIGRPGQMYFQTSKGKKTGKEGYFPETNHYRYSGRFGIKMGIFEYQHILQMVKFYYKYDLQTGSSTLQGSYHVNIDVPLYYLSNPTQV